MDADRTDTEPLVSVVLPTYNRPEFVRGAAASVAAQTYGNIELIVAAGGSRAQISFGRSAGRITASGSRERREGSTDVQRKPATAT